MTVITIRDRIIVIIIQMAYNVTNVIDYIYLINVYLMMFND